MALNAYLTLTGASQGKINGSVTQKGRENTLLVIAVSHEITSPRDSASGLPTGRRQHRPIIITKPIDKATPLLAKALCDNENISSWSLRFYRKKGNVEQHYYTIELQNASIASIQSEMLNNTYKENAPLEVREHISFTYQTIVWTWVDGGISHEDSWAPND